MKRDSSYELRIRTVVFADGERCPMLVNARTEVPLFDPTVWALTIYRPNSAVSTMEQALRGAMLLHVFCARRGIDLAERMRTGAFFGLGEQADLVAEASTRARAGASKSAASGPVNSIGAEQTDVPANRRRNNTRFLRPLPSRKRVPTVRPGTQALRLLYLGDYLEWLGDRQLFRISSSAASGKAEGLTTEIYEAALKKLRTALATRSKRAAKRDGKPSRMALSPNQRDEVLRVIKTDSGDNPWRSLFVRLRNYVIILLLRKTGMRRGELLSLKIRQVQLSLGQAIIVRNHDDNTDPRVQQPVVKTHGRVVPLDADLVALIARYLTERRKIEAANKHGFLFVSTHGKPLSLSSLTKVFVDLRESSPAVGPVTAHVERHNWNEIFTDHADETGMPENEERRLRIELMGWSPTSMMPDYYLSRKTTKKAKEASKDVQRRTMVDADENSWERQIDKSNRRLARRDQS